MTIYTMFSDHSANKNKKKKEEEINQKLEDN